MSNYNLPVGFDGKTTEFHPDVYEQAKYLQWLETEDGLIFAAIVNRETEEMVSFEKDEFQNHVLNGLVLDLREWRPATWKLVYDQGDDNDDSFYSNDTTGKYFN